MMQPEPSAATPISKPDLILIHGFRGSPLGLKTLADDLIKAGYAVHVPAIPPFGGAKMPGEYTSENYASYLASYILTHNLKYPVLIGHSMGSIIAAATAHYYPELVNHKLVLLSPISTKTAPPFAVISPLSAKVSPKIVDYVTTRYLFVPKDRPLFRQALDLTHACTNDQQPSKAEVAAAARFSAHASVADFPLQQNVFMLAGDHDRLVSKRKTVKVANQLGAELQFLPGTGHLHNYEKPHETAAAILRFLEPDTSA